MSHRPPLPDRRRQARRRSVSKVYSLPYKVSVPPCVVGTLLLWLILGRSVVGLGGRGGGRLEPTELLSNLGGRTSPVSQGCPFKKCRIHRRSPPSKEECIEC